MHILITGATGMAGAEVVRQALNDSAVTGITLLTRKPSGFKDPKITEIIQTDFLNYSGLEDEFKRTDACLWCLGISQSRVSKREYYTITHDYVFAAASVMLAVNPEISFLFLSGEGADSTERSTVRFAKVKGQAENALTGLHPQKLYIFRPGGIVASNRNKNESRYKKFEILMVKLMGAIAPWSVVSTKRLAMAMLKVARVGHDKIIIRHKDIKSL